MEYCRGVENPLGRRAYRKIWKTGYARIVKGEGFGDGEGLGFSGNIVKY